MRAAWARTSRLVVPLAFPRSQASRLPGRLSAPCPLPVQPRRSRHMSGLAGAAPGEISINDRVEEETLPFYKAESYYPVSLGETFSGRYKTVAKLGYGTASTIWLCRDLELDRLMTLKVGVAKKATSEVDHELAISQYLSPIEGDHPGKQQLRLVKDDFIVTSDNGSHQCLLFEPLGMSLRQYRNLMPGKVFASELLQHTLHVVLVALDFLHQTEVVHTDISPNNILLGDSEPSRIPEIEQAERDNPSPRKTLADRVIYLSAETPVTHGYPVIADFGAARRGESHRGDVMPGVYRAPEVILDMQWGSPIDIWSVGVMIWNLLEGASLFSGLKDGKLDDEQHLAEMVSLMGPPPPAFLERSPKCGCYWDATGNWIAATPIPQQSLETLEKQLEGRDKDILLSFVRRILRWLPEERPSAVTLTSDEFILQKLPPE